MALMLMRMIRSRMIRSRTIRIRMIRRQTIRNRVMVSKCPVMKGKIRAKGKGNCIIYVYTVNGCAQKITVNVTK